MSLGLTKVDSLACKFSRRRWNLENSKNLLALLIVTASSSEAIKSRSIGQTSWDFRRLFGWLGNCRGPLSLSRYVATMTKLSFAPALRDLFLSKGL